MDSIVLTGDTARTIRRIARQTPGLELTPTTECEISRPDRSRVTLNALGLAPLASLLACDALHPLEVRVGSPAERIRAKGIRSRVCRTALPAGSFELLTSKSPRLSLPSDLQILIDSPELSFVEAAGRLTKLVRQGKLASNEAALRLFKLGAEDCSRYSLDPWQPAAGGCVYDLPLICTADRLRQFTASVHRLNGLTLARDVAALVPDNARSPMECLLYAALSLTPALGGLGLPKPELNQTIPLKGFQQLILNHVDHITPDLLWREFLLVLEYLGELPHEGVWAQHEDAGRMQDFQLLGYEALPVRYGHVSTPKALNDLAARVATIMDQHGARGMRAWVDELRADPSFLQLQKALLMVMLPAVRDR